MPGHIITSRRWKKLEAVKIGICLKDMAFASALADQLARESRNMQFLVGRSEGCHLVLTDPPPDGTGPAEGEVYLSLCSEKNDPEQSVLFRYEDSRMLSRYLSEILFRVTGHITEYRRDLTLRTLCFMQCTGGSGATSLALAAAKMFQVIYGKRCLYMNMQTVNDSWNFFRMTGVTSFNRFLYLLDRHEDIPLGSFLTEGDYCDMLTMPALNPAIEDLNREKLHKIMDILGKTGKYDYALMDLGTSLSRVNRQILKGSDLAVYVRMEKKEPATGFQREAERMIRSMAPSMICVMNGSDESYPWDPERPLLSIAYEPSAFIQMDGRMKLDLRHQMGLDVAELVKKIEEMTSGTRDTAVI